MSYYADPEALAANPPETWRVERWSDGHCVRWDLFIDGGERPLERLKTRREALAERNDPQSYTRRMVEQERLWYAGVTPTGWKTYAECLAERERNEAYQAKRRTERAAV